MKYQILKSIIASRKARLAMQVETDSFYIAKERKSKYIEPTFTKALFDTEKPQILLVSAVGATGKSALAQVLSRELEAPLLDLGKHKPVGDNSITGLLTGAFAIENLTAVFGGLSTGEYVVVVDGIDEGRSKTTESAFNAFLDDITSRCSTSSGTSFVLLGRTQVLEECWLYLTDKGIKTGLVTINPFDLDQAKSYIDASTSGLQSAQSAQYVQARDLILKKLSSAFGAAGSDAPPTNFIAFIGYPPVLDSIATLLEEEKNYQKLIQQLSSSASGDIELPLLNKIATYILERERSEKVFPNIVEPLLPTFAPHLVPVGQEIFNRREQCVRLICHCLGEEIPFPFIEHEPALSTRYEEQLTPFLAEHPFVTGREFRNAIFEAVAASELLVSDDGRLHVLAQRYLDTRRHSHYLIYLLSLVSKGRQFPLICLHSLLGSAMEFKAPGSSVEVSVVADDPDPEVGHSEIDVEITLAMESNSEAVKSFSFASRLSVSDSVRLGSRLSRTYVSVPCEAIIGGGTPEIELTAPIEIGAAKLRFDAQTLVVRVAKEVTKDETYVNFEAGSLDSEVTTVANAANIPVSIALDEVAALRYPLVQYSKKKEILPKDPLQREKYLRLRKMLTHFRSHSKGALAKYRDKIEHPRVAGNPVGQAVLGRLVSDGVLYLDGSLYFLDPGKVDKFLGVSWPDLRRGEHNQRLLDYLAAIAV